MRVAVVNDGYLPTFVTQRAVDNGVAKTVKAHLSLGDAMDLVMGKATADLGHLAGRAERRSTWSPWMRQWSRTSGEAEWLVRAPNGGQVRVQVVSEKGGASRATVQLHKA